MLFEGTKVNGKWKMMNYRSYYENVRVAAKGFIKVIIILVIIIIIIIIIEQCLWCCHCESSPLSSDECRTVPNG